VLDRSGSPACSTATANPRLPRAQAAGIPLYAEHDVDDSIEDVASAVEKPFWFQLY